jgi:mannose-6-phosphate isomerase-like protein (cupin superfamily)
MNKYEKAKPISFLTPTLVEKKWGKDGIGEIILVNNEFYCLKILQFTAGKSFSMHYHNKHETWYLAEGEMLMEYYDLDSADSLKRDLVKGDIIHVPAMNPHKLISKTDATIYEVSTTAYEWDNYKIGKGSSQSE